MDSRLASGVAWVFRGSDDSRLRASWRIAIAVCLTFIGVLFGGLVVQRADLSALVIPVVAHGFAVLAVIATAGIVARYVDYRDISEYGFSLSRRWAVDVVVGTLIGIGLVGLAFLFAYQQGTLTILDRFSPGSANSLAFGFGVVVVGWIFVGIWEETLFRGLFLRNAAEGVTARGGSSIIAAAGAWLSSSLAYGFVHGPLGSNPEAVSVIYALVMTSVMGGLFGLAYLLSGELALPIGLHTGINFAEHNLFFGPPAGTGPAVLRTEHAVSGAHVQFQSITPNVILPVFVCGYLLITGWVYLRRGALVIDV